MKAPRDLQAQFATAVAKEAKRIKPARQPKRVSQGPTWVVGADLETDRPRFLCRSEKLKTWTVVYEPARAKEFQGQAEAAAAAADFTAQQARSSHPAGAWEAVEMTASFRFRRP